MRLLLILIVVCLGLASEGHCGDKAASCFRREGGVSSGETSRFPGVLDESEWKFHAEVFQLSKNKLLAVRPGGKGDVTESHVAWDYERNLPSVSSPLVYRGVLYMVKDGGIVTSVDPETGAALKRGRARGVGKYYASPVAADGRIYLASERGMLTILKAGAQWEVESYRDFEERIMATPVLRDGIVYLRTDDALYAFGAAE